jgi:AcrR family transcriptional regulator
MSERRSKRRKTAEVLTGRESGVGRDSEAFLTVSELSVATGVPVPSIHHYRRLGLLPDPILVASNRFLYDQRHVAALKAIRALRNQRGLPLAVIRQVLPELLAAGESHCLGDGVWEAVLMSHVDAGGRALPPPRLVAVARESFVRLGYDGVSVGDICDASGIAKGSFYRFFDSKYDLFLFVVRSTVDAVGSRFDDLPAPADEAEAVAELRSLLAPIIPLYLEVMARELRGEREMSGMSAGIADGLAARITPRLLRRGQSAIATGRRVVDSAILSLLRPALGRS